MIQSTITRDKHSGRYEIKSPGSTIGTFASFDEAVAIAHKVSLGVFIVECEIPERMTGETYALLQRKTRLKNESV